MKSKQPELIDKFNRRIDYLRISVTDRCNFRCVYCMPEKMTFMPRKNILTLEEILTVAKSFINMGTRKIRITGGEPLIRENIMWLFNELGRLNGLDELLVTTNGYNLAEMAGPLKEAGVSRINVSLDTLQKDRFEKMARVDGLRKVLDGIQEAKKVGFTHVKLNAVILKGYNDDEITNLVDFAVNNELDISFIEEMPLGMISSHNRGECYISSDEILGIIKKSYGIAESNYQTGGPSRYIHIADSKTDLGFISPHSHNFCETCNRVRLTAEGRLLLCLGNENSVDLREVIRSNKVSDKTLSDLIKTSVKSDKPEKHYFDFDMEPQVLRFMNATGG
ncbi:cyclic pyranopterin phosphate synthase MoaA [Gammaproteobacteria bacterium 42_54_T18]|nr:cyclic pyranopterin phosphate synthase MoaA [Gammaproteobacteria bacterium 42_54_T18]